MLRQKTVLEKDKHRADVKVSMDETNISSRDTHKISRKLFIIGDTKLKYFLLRINKLIPNISQIPILVFIFLLIGAIMLLIIGNKIFAEMFAEWGFYMLIAGVMIQLVESAMKSRNKKNEIIESNN